MTSSIAAEFERLGPWVTSFEIDGHAYGGGYDAALRIGQFAECFPGASTILELGSLEGGHSVCLAQLPGVSKVVSIEGRTENIERARFVVKLLGLTNVEFVRANLEDFDLASLGGFDAVFNCGLLYHLPEPWTLLQNVARMTDHMYLRDGASPSRAGGLHLTTRRCQ